MQGEDRGRVLPVLFLFKKWAEGSRSNFFDCNVLSTEREN